MVMVFSSLSQCLLSLQETIGLVDKIDLYEEEWDDAVLYS